jgi:hypothetical protein
MASINLILGLSNVFCAVPVIGLSLPLLRGKVKRNLLYGMRFAKSLESDERWYEINAYGARRMIFWSVVLLLIGVITFFVPLEGRLLRSLFFAFAPLLYLIPTLETYRYARKR